MSETLVKRLEAFRQIGVGPTKGHDLINNGDLPPPIKIGRCALFLQSDIDAFIAKLKAERDERAAG